MSRRKKSLLKWNERSWEQMRPGSPIPATRKCLRGFERARTRLGGKFGTRLCTNIAAVRFSALCLCPLRPFYNAIFFTYALVLMRFYSVPEQNVGGYLLPFALGNVLGPLLLGYLFDTIGRKQMITLTYGLAGILLALTGWLFHAGLLTAQTQTLAWTIIFFVASAAASSAYLTVSEIFPLEIRAMAIAIFYAIGTLVGGVGAPILFGWIIGTGSKTALFVGYLVGAALMILGALVEAYIGVPAERQSLEHVAAPLSSKGL